MSIWGVRRSWGRRRRPGFALKIPALFWNNSSTPALSLDFLLMDWLAVAFKQILDWGHNPFLGRCSVCAVFHWFLPLPHSSLNDWPALWYFRPGIEDPYQSSHSPALREEYAYGSYYYHGYPQQLPEERGMEKSPRSLWDGTAHLIDGPEATGAVLRTSPRASCWAEAETPPPPASFLTRWGHS